MFTLVVRYSVNVPVTDQYEFVPIFQKLDAGVVPLGDFWEQHNEHRIVFPTIILVLLAKITHWNILAEVYLSFFTACVAFIGLIGLINRRIINSTLKFGAIFLAAWIFFSPVQWENWLWGWQFEWFLCIACIIWSINLLDKLEKKNGTPNKLLAPIGLAIVATFSLGSGFLIWIAGLAMMLIRNIKHQLLYLWSGITLISLGIYYFKYHKPENGLSSTSFLQDLPSFLKNYLAFLGRPISDDTRVAVFAGLYILVGFIIVLGVIAYKKKIHDMAAIICMGAVGLAAGLLTGMARFDYGIAASLSSRYTAFSNLIIISLIVMVIYLLQEIKYRKDWGTGLAMAAVFLIVVPAISYGWRSGLNGIKIRSNLYTYIYNCSREVRPTHQCLYEIFFPDTVRAQDNLDYLKQKHYGGY